MVAATKYAEVRRILDRYITEVVVAYDLCPWALRARDGHEIGVEVVLGQPTDAEWLTAATRALATPGVRVAMVVAPELADELPVVRATRDRIAAALPDAGVAEFHPRAALDLATPARLVPFLRRAPDPLLQLVPLALLDSVRGSPLPDRAAQAQILRGLAAPPRDVAAQIATANHATATARARDIERVLEDIATDRAAAYARVGISCAFR
jgi:hypothetical protein